MKTAALTRTMKVMAEGLEGGTSFMEDYTYHFTPQKIMYWGPTCWRFVLRLQVQIHLVKYILWESEVKKTL